MQARQLRALAEIASVVSDPDRAGVVDAVLDELQTVVPWVGVSLSAFDPFTGRHRTVGSRDYSAGLVRFLDGSYLDIDPGYHWMLRNRQSYFNWSLPDFDYSSTFSAVRWFRPAGYLGGSSNYLTSRDDRYVGNLHISTDRRDWPSVEVLESLAALTPLVAPLVDTWHEPRRFLRTELAGYCGTLITRSRSAHRVPGHEACSSCAGAGELLALARSLVAATPEQRGLRLLQHVIPPRCWYTDASGAHLVRFVRCREGWLLAHAPEPLPHGLSARQLEICSLLALGLTNREIANDLRLAPKTVGHHVDHIFGKLDVTARAAVAAVAAHEGLLHLRHLASGRPPPASRGR